MGYMAAFCLQGDNPHEDVDFIKHPNPPWCRFHDPPHPIPTMTYISWPTPPHHTIDFMDFKNLYYVNKAVHLQGDLHQELFNTPVTLDFDLLINDFRQILQHYKQVALLIVATNSERHQKNNSTNSRK